MRKIIVFNMVSLDGYYAGTKGEIDWHHVDAEFNEFAINQLREIGILLFGRVTYDLMADYWSSEQAIKNDPIVAGLMNDSEKMIFSKTLEKVKWNNSKLVHDINPSEILKLKQQAGKDLFIFGSGQLIEEFSKLKLIDEYRLMINPIILGSGKSFFKDKQNLALLNTKIFQNGNVLLCYGFK